MRELKGTEKQISWASDILRMLSEVEEQFNVALDEMTKLGKTEKEVNKEIDYTYLTIEEVKRTFKNIKTCEDSGIIIDAFKGLKERFIENLKQYNSNGKETGKTIWYRNTIGDTALMFGDHVEIFEIEGNPEYSRLNIEGYKAQEVKKIRARMLKDINGYVKAVEREIEYGGKPSRRQMVLKARSLKLLEKIKTENNMEWYLKSQYEEVDRYSKDWE